MRFLETHPLVDRAIPVAMLLAGAYGIFLLPYQFPSKIPLLDSPAYNVGFNTNVAILSVVCLAGALALYRICRGIGDGDPVIAVFDRLAGSGDREFARMPIGVLAAVLALYTVLNGFIYYAIPVLDEYGEARYNLKFFDLAVHCGQYPYRDVYYLYAPLHFYIPVAFIKAGAWCGLSLEFSYFLVVMFLTWIGLALLFWTVDSFRIQVDYRITIFATLALAYYNTALGTASTLSRYGAPFAVLLCSHRFSHLADALEGRKAFWGHALIGLASSLLVLGISSEFGVVFLVAWAIYCLHRGAFVAKSTLAGVAGIALSLPLWQSMFPGSLSRVAGGAGGAHNFPMLPGPHILIFLAVIFWTVPRVIQACVTKTPAPNASLALAWTAYGMGLLPAALGRCEFMHVFSNGLSLFLLAMAGMANVNRRLFVYFMICFITVYCITMRVVEFADAGPRLVPVRMALGGQRVVAADDKAGFLLQKEALRLEELRNVGIPLGAPRELRRYLIDAGRYAHAYIVDPLDVTSPVELQRKVQDLEKAEYLLVPENIFGLRGVTDGQVTAYRQQMQAQVDQNISIWLGTHFLLPYRFQSKYLPFDPQFEESRYIANHYRPIRKSGGWAIAVKDTGQKDEDVDQSPSVRGP